VGHKKPAGGLLSLLKVCIAGASKNQTAGHPSDGHGDVELAGDAAEMALHALRRALSTERLSLLYLQDGMVERDETLMSNEVHQWWGSTDENRFDCPAVTSSIR
jgi:hypothetical protein